MTVASLSHASFLDDPDQAVVGDAMVTPIAGGTLLAPVQSGERDVRRSRPG